MTNFLKSIFRFFGRASLGALSFIITLILVGCFFAGAGAILMSGFENETSRPTPQHSHYKYLSGEKHSSNQLLMIPIEGVILGSTQQTMRGLSIPGITFGYSIKDLLKEASEDDSIKGILLHLQTPGGTIFGSYAIYQGIKDYQKKTGKPVVAYIEGLAASGGVMAMVGADKIYADHGSLIGSIGVIGPLLRYYDKPMATQGGLFGGGITTSGGIEHTVISAGRGKDLGNPFRRPTPEELENLQNGINHEYDNFVQHVANNRKRSTDLIRNTMGAQGFDNATAEKYGLIDGTLNRDDTITALAKAAKINDDFKLVTPGAQYPFPWGSWLRFFSGQQSESPNWMHHQCRNQFRAPLSYYGNVMDLQQICEHHGRR